MEAESRFMGTERLIRLLAAPAMESKQAEQDGHTAGAEIPGHCRRWGGEEGPADAGWGGRGGTHRAWKESESRTLCYCSASEFTLPQIHGDLIKVPLQRQD